MDIRDNGILLKKIKFSQLESGLRHEILDLAAMMGHETAIRADSDLHFLFRLYQAEKAKEKKSRKALKKAEDMILRLVSLQHDSVKTTSKKWKGKERRRPRLALLGERLPISRKTKKLLESIGITDGRDVELIVGLLGEAKVEERVELVQISNIGETLAKAIFPKHTEIFIVADDDSFVAGLEGMEGKKGVIDAWKSAKGITPPAEADYEKTPDVLLRDYKQITEMLGVIPLIKRKAESAEEAEESPGYRNKPMDPDKFMKVMLSMGFSVVREAKHGTLIMRGDTIMAVQKAHRKQMQLNKATIKKKLIEAGIDLGDFQEERDRLKL